MQYRQYIIITKKPLASNCWEINQKTPKWSIIFWTKLADWKQKKWTSPLNFANSNSLETKFNFKQAILNFETKFAKKGRFWSKTEKVNIATEFCIFKLVYALNFSLNWQLRFYGPNLPRNGTSGQKRKKVNTTIDF